MFETQIPPDAQDNDLPVEVAALEQLIQTQEPSHRRTFRRQQPQTIAGRSNCTRAETTSHYTRDATVGEERSRIRCNPGIFERLRSFGFIILKANKMGTLNQDRYRVALRGLEALSNLVIFR